MALVRPSTRHFLEYLPEIGPQSPVLGYISSGPQSGTGNPVIIGPPIAAYAFTGSPNFGGSPPPVLPLTLTVPLPPNILPGDVLFAKLKMIPTGGNGAIHDLDAVSGWTEVFSTFEDNAYFLLYHVVTGSEAPTVTFSYSAPGFAFAGFALDCLMIAVRGADNTHPVDVFALNAGATSSLATAPSVATSVPNDLILIYMDPLTTSRIVTNATTPLGTTLQINFQSPNGPFEDSSYLWSQDFIGSGTAGPYVSSGWVDFFITLTVAVKPGPPPGSIQGFPAGANGAIVPSPVITGPATKLVAPQGLWIDSAAALWVADAKSNTNGAILAFGHPSTSGTNTAPDINLTGSSTTLLNPYDVVTDLPGNLYVANYGNNDVLIFTPGSNGNTAPALTIGGGSTTISKPRSVAVASNGDVFVINDTQNKILVFTAGHTGNVAPDRVITGAATLLNNPLAMRFDSDGHLWVTCAGYLLEFLETDNGNVAPQTQVINSGLEAGFDLGIDFDVNNNAFVSVLLAQDVLEFQDDSFSGMPIATITGWLSGPWGIAVNKIVTPPPNITCIPIEWQTAGKLLDEGRLALCTRFFVDIATHGEELSVVICVDDVDHAYPFLIGNTDRSTIELDFQVSGRIYSLRLTGCLTIGQVELFRCWTDLDLGREPGAMQEAAGGVQPGTA